MNWVDFHCNGDPNFVYLEWYHLHYRFDVVLLDLKPKLPIIRLDLIQSLELWKTNKRIAIDIIIRLIYCSNIWLV